MDMIKIKGSSDHFTVQSDNQTYYGQLIELHDDDSETWGVYNDENYGDLIRENLFEQQVLDKESLLDVINELLQETWEVESVEIDFL